MAVIYNFPTLKTSRKKKREIPLKLQYELTITREQAVYLMDIMRWSIQKTNEAIAYEKKIDNKKERLESYRKYRRQSRKLLTRISNFLKSLKKARKFILDEESFRLLIDSIEAENERLFFNGDEMSNKEWEIYKVIYPALCFWKKTTPKMVLRRE